MKRRRFFKGEPIAGTSCKDVTWFNPHGVEMTHSEWEQPFVRCLGLSIIGRRMDELDAHGEPVHDENFLLLLNAHHDPISFTLPECSPREQWDLLLDTNFMPLAPRGRPAHGESELPFATADEGQERAPARYAAGEVYPLGGRCLALFVESRVSGQEVYP